MAKVTETKIETTLPEGFVRKLLAGLALTSNNTATTYDEEQVLNWAESLQLEMTKNLIEHPFDDVVPGERIPDFINLSDVMYGNKLVKITDDGALAFVDSAPYIQAALKDVMENCAICTDLDCPLSPANPKNNLVNLN